jgi:hypothetical protein
MLDSEYGKLFQREEWQREGVPFSLWEKGWG